MGFKFGVKEKDYNDKFEIVLEIEGDILHYFVVDRVTDDNVYHRSIPLKRMVSLEYIYRELESISNEPILMDETDEQRHYVVGLVLFTCYGIK